MSVRGIVSVGLLAASMSVGVLPANAATVPSGYTDALVAGGLNDPTAMEIVPDGRILVTEKGGTLRVIKNGALLATPMLSLSVNSAGERGLLGVALHPDFPSVPYLYVYYTTSTEPIHNRVSRFSVSGDIVVGSETPILDLGALIATNHNGGAIHFGPDRNLYVAVGENGRPSKAQALGSKLGKMLRIKRNGVAPSDNPFVGVSGADPRVWALGLRNPFTFAFQPGTGRMYINDVGQNTWEEINRGFPGANYGWPSKEGPTSGPRFRSPVYAYLHSGSPGGCAIAGGAFYNPAVPQFTTDLVGDYFFADLCGGWIRTLDVATKTPSPFASGITNPVDLKVGSEGTLYYVERGTGSVRKITRP